jgi:hypothetical protein
LETDHVVVSGERKRERAIAAESSSHSSVRERTKGG